jgi:hypothetical protein
MQFSLPKILDLQVAEKVREGLRKSAGALKGVDIAALQRDIRDQRGQDSKGWPA